ncbi:MAG: YeeE/YedE thiosulfate transporter family protein [Deltaproteobacteria bacterium]
MKTLLFNAAMGLALGFALTRIGFADFGEVHAMFLLTDLRLVFTFGGAVALAYVGFRLTAKRPGRRPAKPMHGGVVPGSVLFGVGWAITGACPGIVIAQLGAGQLAALLTLGGMLFGAWLAGRVFNPRPVLAPRGRAYQD